MKIIINNKEISPTIIVIILVPILIGLINLIVRIIGHIIY